MEVKTLNNGVKMPLLGLGVMICRKPNQQSKTPCRWAIAISTLLLPMAMKRGSGRQLKIQPCPGTRFS